MKRDVSCTPLHVSAREEQAWNEQQLAQPVDSPQLRLWRYTAPALVLGCAQRAVLTQPPSPALHGMDAMPRHTGGGAVLVGPWMLGVSVALPPGHPLVAGGPVPAYRWLGECFADVLAQLGLAAHALAPHEVHGIQQAHDMGKDLDWACYGGFSPWEVVVDRRKIVGLAQLRRRAGVLLVAGLLLDRPDWPALCRAMQRPATLAYHLHQRTTSLAEQLGFAPELDDIAHPLAWRLQAAIHGPHHPADSFHDHNEGDSS